jgi:hypothetical protein
MIETCPNRTDFEKLICLWVSTPRKILSGFGANFPKTHRFQQSEKGSMDLECPTKFLMDFPIDGGVSL